MPIENKFERCEPDDPHRCQSSGKHGQCPYLAERRSDGTFYNYCVRHLAGTKKYEERAKMRNYRLDKFQARVGEFADNDAIKNLREEVGIARMMLEEVVNRCKDTDDLLMSSNKISDMIGRIEKLVVSCHRLEQSSGMLLDKATLMKLADVIVAIIGKHELPEEVVQAVALEIVKAIVDVRGEDKKE